MLRRRPTLEELQAWRNQRAEAVDKFILEEKQEEAITALKVLEADMNQLRTAVEYGIDEIAPDHRTFSRAGELVGVDELHIPTPSVEQCRLLDVDVIAGQVR